MNDEMYFCILSDPTVYRVRHFAQYDDDGQVNTLLLKIYIAFKMQFIP